MVKTWSGQVRVSVGVRRIPLGDLAIVTQFVTHPGACAAGEAETGRGLPPPTCFSLL
jgi:hypothetical protein